LAASDESRLGSRAERYERAASLLERAFEADPDSIPVAGRLATVLLEEHQAQRVVSLFRMALDRAKSRDTLVMLGSEIARVARHDLNDIATGIDALRRVRAAVPQHLPSLLTLAELCIAQRAWPEAVDVLESAAASDAEAAMRLTALFALASIYEKVIVRPIDLDRVLRTALTIDPSNPRALLALIRRLTAEPMGRDEAAAERRRKEISELLSRLADVETDAERKTGILVELSEVNLRLGDVQGAKNALIEAAAAMPSNGRAFSHLEVIFRHGDDLDRVGFAQALSEVIQKGERLGQTSAHWFAALGRIEVQDPSTVQIGLSHLERAVEMDPTLYKTRFEVATRYAQQKASDKAARVLIDLLAPTAQPLLGLDDPPGALALLETSLVEVGRTDEATVVSELRALAGDLDAQHLEWLRGRPLPPLQAAQGTLGRTTLVAQVVPSAGRHVLLEVAAAIAGIQGKILRSDLSELGITPRDRVTARSGHPTRILFDRVCRLLGVDDVELVIAARATRTRVLSHDEPWVVIPAALVDQGQPAQLASISRALARLALGVPWLDELPAKNILALLVAAARQVAAGYAPEEPGLAGPYEASLSRVLARRQRKLLEELAPRLASPQASLPAPDEFVRGLFQAEVRTQFLITGDIQGAVEEEAERDPALAEATAVPGGRALAATLLHPLVGDVVRFALTPEATGLRRRVGSVWSRSRVSA
jgi:tetratricopeptide (TPR) repeat protein